MYDATVQNQYLEGGAGLICGENTASQIDDDPKTFDFIESLFPAFPVGKKKSLNNAFRLFAVERVLLKR